VSVLSFGFFVELDAYPIEGLVRADALHDDRYVYIEEERALKGLRTRQRFRLGDRVRVEASNVSLRRREIDLALLERLTPAIEEGAGGGKRSTARAGKKSKGLRRRTVVKRHGEKRRSRDRT